MSGAGSVSRTGRAAAALVMVAAAAVPPLSMALLLHVDRTAGSHTDWAWLRVEDASVRPGRAAHQCRTGNHIAERAAPRPPSFPFNHRSSTKHNARTCRK